MMFEAIFKFGDDVGDLLLAAAFETLQIGQDRRLGLIHSLIGEKSYRSYSLIKIMRLIIILMSLLITYTGSTVSTGAGVDNKTRYGINYKHAQK